MVLCLKVALLKKQKNKKKSSIIKKWFKPIEKLATLILARTEEESLKKFHFERGNPENMYPRKPTKSYISVQRMSCIQSMLSFHITEILMANHRVAQYCQLLETNISEFRQQFLL